VRTLVGVLLVLLVLAPLAAAAVRGVRRGAWADQVEDAGRTTLQTLVEGLIVLAVLVVGVLILVALLD
jgi:ABC-type anion transport system duplicated permease subunit